MTPTIEATRPKLNIPEVTPRLNLPEDLPTVIHPYPSAEFPRVQQEPEMQVNMDHVRESRRRQTQILDENGLGLPKKMRTVVDSFVGIAIKNETSLFHNGDEKITFADKDRAQDLYHQLRGVMTTECSDYFDENGIVKKDERDDKGRIRMDQKTETGWNNIVAIAPKIAEIFLSKDHNIKSVNRDQFIDVFRFAIKVTEDPSLLERTTISVGFGGSADIATSSRLPAYGLSAQLIAEKVNQFYQERLNTSIDKARVKKYEREQITQQKEKYGDSLPPLIEDYIARVSQGYLQAEKKAEATGSSLQLLPLLTEDELVEVKQTNAIPDKPMKLRFFSGAEAGIVSNFPDKAETVRTRREENWQVIKDFSAKYFPGLKSQIYFQNDVPWELHTPEQHVALEYFAHLLRTSHKDSIRQTVSFVQGLGQAKGGQNGEELAAEYAGEHLNFFRDKNKLPRIFTDIFEITPEDKKPEINISIGGKSEESFSGIRDYLAEHATPEDLRDFIQIKAARLELDMFEAVQIHGETIRQNGHAAEYHARIAEIQNLRTMAMKLDEDIRKGIEDDSNPRMSIHISSASGIAGYYVGPGDERYGVNPEEQIDRIDNTMYIPSEPEYEDVAKAATIHAKEVKDDLIRIVKATKKAA